MQGIGKTEGVFSFFILQWVSLPEEMSLVAAFLCRKVIFGRAEAAEQAMVCGTPGAEPPSPTGGDARCCRRVGRVCSEPRHPACCPRALVASVEEAESKGWNVPPEVFQTQTSNTRREITAVASALPLAAGAVFHCDTLMPLKNILLSSGDVSVYIHSTRGNSLLPRSLLSVQGTAAHHRTKPLQETQFSTFLN